MATGMKGHFHGMFRCGRFRAVENSSASVPRSSACNPHGQGRADGVHSEDWRSFAITDLPWFHRAVVVGSVAAEAAARRRRSLCPNRAWKAPLRNRPFAPNSASSWALGRLWWWGYAYHWIFLIGWLISIGNETGGCPVEGPPSFVEGGNLASTQPHRDGS